MTALSPFVAGPLNHSHSTILMTKWNKIKSPRRKKKKFKSPWITTNVFISLVFPLECAIFHVIPFKCADNIQMSTKLSNILRFNADRKYNRTNLHGKTINRPVNECAGQLPSPMPLIWHRLLAECEQASELHGFMGYRELVNWLSKQLNSFERFTPRCSGWIGISKSPN